MLILRCGSAIFVAGAGNREVARCDGVDISWQAQYFVRVRRVDAERCVAGAGNREVRVLFGRGWNRRNCIGIGCVMRVLRLEGLESYETASGLRDAPLETFGGSLVRNARFGDLTCDFWRKSRTKRSVLET